MARGRLEGRPRASTLPLAILRDAALRGPQDEVVSFVLAMEPNTVPEHCSVEAPLDFAFAPSGVDPVLIFHMAAERKSS